MLTLLSIVWHISFNFFHRSRKFKSFLTTGQYKFQVLLQVLLDDLMACIPIILVWILTVLPWKPRRSQSIGG